MLTSKGSLGFVVSLLPQLIHILHPHHHQAAPPPLFATAFPAATTTTTTGASLSLSKITTLRKKSIRLKSTRGYETSSRNDTQTISTFAASSPPRPIIDQEGRQWRSSAQLATLNLVRDGLDDLERDVKNRTTSRRRYYSHKHNSLSTSFVVTLRRHSLLLRDEKKGGFVNDDERWMHRYDDLCRFRERYGHTCVPFARTGSDAFMKDGVMSEEEVLSLYEEDDEEDDDDGPSPGDVNENEPDQHLELGYWVAQQRHYYKQRSLHGEYGIGRRLTPDRIDNLNKLGFIWDVKEARWEMQYLALQEFVLDHGHASVTHNSTLGHWCYKQRYHQRNIENGVTVDWACIPEEAYRPISSEVGRDYSILEEDWVIETAAGGKEYKDRPVSPLTAERRAKLDAIGFIWNVREQGETRQFIHTYKCEGMQMHQLCVTSSLFYRLGRPIPITLQIPAKIQNHQSALVVWKTWRMGQETKRGMEASTDSWI